MFLRVYTVRDNFQIMIDSELDSNKNYDNSLRFTY